MREFNALPPAADFSVAPALPGAVGGPPENPFEIFHKIHRLLRGRYIYAIAFGAIGALGGAALGYLSTVPKYQSVGLIRIKSQRPVVYVLPENQGMVGNGSVRSIAQLLQTPRVIDKAMQSDEWKRMGRGITDDSKDEFKDALRVDTDPGASEWIYVRFTDRQPKVAQTAVEQIINAYIALYGDDDRVVYPELITNLQNRVKAFGAEITTIQSQINSIGLPFGTTDLETLHRDSMEQLKELERTYQQLELQIKLAENVKGVPNVEAPPAPAEPDWDSIASDIAKTDEAMKALMGHLDDAKAYLSLLMARGLTDAHPSVFKAKASVQSLQSQIHVLTKKWMDQHPGQANGPDGGVAKLNPEQLRNAKSVFETIKARRDAVHQRTLALNQARLDIANLTDQIKKLQGSQADVERRLNQLSTESSPSEAAGVSDRINIISKGDEPHRPYSDSRKKLAGLGFLLGGGFPVALVLLWGLMDRRYRYSDDASASATQPTLLGILPFLPEDMSDPEQAAVAAHCVHQIRTLLQISAAQMGKRVFAVTSPTSGDGKTSLSMSLALSFASSGANTCLIDFDLIGCGLTSAMNAKTQLGLMDAVEHAELNGQIRETGFKRLSIVPAGRDDAALVATLSPESVRRIIKQARDKFDVVIIDTGPILGSLEASLVTSAADGVILALGRGQARPLAERAIKHLASVGATLMGVVFNRAQPNDFRRAISSASVRSVPNQGGARTPVDTLSLPAMGPMARTVASNVRPADHPTDAH